WTLQAVIDPTTGQLGITLFSATPIRSPASGSLVTITFHVLGAMPDGASPIQLVASVNPNGRGPIRTALDDDQGPLTVHLVPTAPATGTTTEGTVVLTATDPVRASKVNDGGVGTKDNGPAV